MTIPANLAGLPALSLPCGFDAQGLPIGLQMVSNVLREDILFQIAYGYEQSTDWHKRSPTISL
jgi:aspartyl-tRNA(Asn)/glutamyl-tRNA(Gln) amidotransferase subunit A